MSNLHQVLRQLKQPHKQIIKHDPMCNMKIRNDISHNSISKKRIRTICIQDKIIKIKSKKIKDLTLVFYRHPLPYLFVPNPQLLTTFFENIVSVKYGIAEI